MTVVEEVMKTQWVRDRIKARISEAAAFVQYLRDFYSDPANHLSYMDITKQEIRKFTSHLSIDDLQAIAKQQGFVYKSWDKIMFPTLPFAAETRTTSKRI